MIAIDLFAGAGGWTEGAKRAGVKVIYAANHSLPTVRYHSLNHPDALHVCQDLHQADWREVPKHDVLLASPACGGHTPARGKERPHHDALRNTAWAVVDCVEHHRSPFVLVENVAKFTRWILYPAWADAMRRLGYAIAPHVIDSADHGVPQNRVRVYLVCSHTRSPLKLALPKRPHTPINDVIEWDAHTWNPIETDKRVDATLRRIASGRAAFGERFVAPYYSNGSGLTGRSIHRPIGTITTVDRWAVINGDRMRMLQISEAKAAMSFQQEYILPPAHKQAMHMLGNAVTPVVAKDIIEALKLAA